LTPRNALALGLKIDAQALSPSVVEANGRVVKIDFAVLVDTMDKTGIQLAQALARHIDARDKLAAINLATITLIVLALSLVSPYL
jgi:hypothetical protein